MQLDHENAYHVRHCLRWSRLLDSAKTSRCGRVSPLLDENSDVMAILESASDGVGRLDLSNVYICQSIDGAYFDLYGEGTFLGLPS